MVRKICLYLVLVLIGLNGCRDEDNKSAETRVDDIYFDYSVIAEEGREMVSCLFRFREDDLAGDPITLSETVMLTFDGLEIAADSARMAGTFYEIMLPLNQFEGEHTVLFRAPSGREYSETFVFRPFAISQELPPRISRKNFNIQMEGLPENETISLVLTDTSFLSNDFNGIVTVEKNALTIPIEKLSEVKNGPVIFQIQREEIKNLKDAPGQGGRLLIQYGLQREFILTD